MSAARPPSPLSHLRHGVSAGLCGGSVAGAGEALFVLSASRPAEYQALLWGALLYGLAGAGLGLVCGVISVVADRVLGSRLDEAGRLWALVFVGVALALGSATVEPLVEALWNAREDVPGIVFGCVAAALAFAGGGALWLTERLVTRTPLRALLDVNGAAVAWGGGIVLAFLFSRAPAPGTPGTLAPHRPQAGLFAEKPQIILVVIDSLRADAIGAYGAPPSGASRGASPLLDAFAADAILFEQAIAAASSTRAAMASLLTSLSPSTHGCGAREPVLTDAVQTVAEVLRANGYATGGLPNSAHVAGSRGFDQGFDWFPFTPDHPLGASESTSALTLYRAGRLLWERYEAGGGRVERAYAPAEVQLARARAYIDANAPDRYFLLVHLMEPHEPWFGHPATGRPYRRVDHPAPDPAEADALRALYAGEVAHVDAELGRFFAGLEEAGLYDEALIVVTADHGEELGDRGGWWHGTTLHDEQVRVPLLVKLPGQERAGTRIPWQVRQIDIAPTLVDSAGFGPEPSWQGVAIFDDRIDDHLVLLEPPPPVDDPDEPWIRPTWAVHPASRDALSELEGAGWRMQSLRTRGRKLIETRSGGDAATVAAYELLADPDERVDVAEQAPWVRPARRNLEAWADALRAARVEMEAGPADPADPK